MQNARNRTPHMAAMGMVVLAALAIAAAPPYDPLATPAEVKSQTIDFQIADKQRQRDIPIRVYLPTGTAPSPVVLFSHGLGGSREGNAYLGRHWAARGYVAVFLQHPGSDTSVWKDKPPAQRMEAMRQAANGKNFLLRVKDIPAVLDQLERWNKDEGHTLAGRLDMAHVGMSGHSFGAVTTQAVSGQRTARGGTGLADSRIDAAVVMSPSSPRRGTARAAFSKVSLPWLLMTGTKDVSPIGNADLQSRLAVFASLLPGGKYELVLDGAEHSAFSERSPRGKSGARNPNHHRAILAVSTAFWDAYLGNDSLARDWLDGDGAKSVLEKSDRWQRK